MFFKTLVKLRSLTIYLLSCLILLTSCDSKTNDNGNKISNVVYDGFLDIYDLIGVYITAVDPNLNLIAVTPSGAYFHYYEDAAVNAKKVLMAANKPQVPVSSERAIPICPPKKNPLQHLLLNQQTIYIYHQAPINLSQFQEKI